ncbi:uncharacterized protein N0V89_005325 [Didymosphaeria variabile]|uniref:Ribosome biogenesis protein SLX9 n=1 Tax=Didymosphaeria variabile TaxID=1932322 RepID=A0A9W8XMY9_9PLEO|nr:uncharacterized protein N0V89_005325 [Didymosphaeria variabile]KAJ4353595.1 hypothetical protein N0V89_005325 [Didymosphaeria variabile]
MPPATLETKDIVEHALAGGPTGNGTAQLKSRFTRAEKRKFARGKKAIQVPQAPKNNTKPKIDFRNSASVKLDISKLLPSQIDTYLALLEAKARVGRSKPSSLADRVTRDNVKKEKAGEKPKKELSAAKLDKIEKRRQLRAARKEAWLAKKVADVEKKEPTEATPAAVPAKSPVRTAATSRPPSRRASAIARSPARTRSASIVPATLPHPEDTFEELEY